MHDDEILIIPPDVDVAALGAFILEGGPMPEGCHREPFAEWTARGRLPDCDCDLLQCACDVIRPHQPDCSFRLSITSPVDVGPMDCDCGAV